MLDNLLSIIPQGNVRHPIAWNRLTDTLKIRMNVARNKFLAAATPRTPLVEMLKWMCLNFDIKAVDNNPNDISRLTNTIQNYQIEFRNAFDPIWTRSLSRNKLFKSSTKTQPIEIFINSSVSNFADYPLDSNWVEWQAERAIRILYFNSTELPIEMFTGKFVFNTKSPSFAVISLNVQTLLMKWYKYVKFCEIEKDEPNFLDFLKITEFNNLFDDILEVWTTNLILTCLVNPQASADVISAEMVVPGFITTGGILKNGIQGLQEILKLISSRNLKLQDFLDTKWYDKDISVRDKISEIERGVIVPDLRQYHWIEVLKTLPYLRMMIAIIHQDRDNPLYNVLVNKAYWAYVKHIKYTQWPNYQYTSVLKEYIEAVSRNFERLFKEDKITDAMEMTPGS